MELLTRGQKVKLATLTPATNLEIGLSVTAPAGMIFDISCFGVDTQEQLSDDRYFIFYNQKATPCGGLTAIGAGSGDQERFQLDLFRLPVTIYKLVFTITVDGEGNMAQLKEGHLRLRVGKAELARFLFRGTDFHAEKAVIVGEIYRKEGWRLAAVGQGFNGGLSALLQHFGGRESVAPPAPPPRPTRLVSLEKRIAKEAPQLVSLAKTLTVSLEKKKLQDVTAKVALVLDASGSMIPQYERGDLQLVVEKVVPIATHFDDDVSWIPGPLLTKSRRYLPLLSRM